ncbi:MAG: hypothetical protein SFY92_02550 [Verrucomicrobiae bacterium]|nr:hypothetical protein [Verrucomicrobiae bacterium]
MNPRGPLFILLFLCSAAVGVATEKTDIPRTLTQKQSELILQEAGKKQVLQEELRFYWMVDAGEKPHCTLINRIELLERDQPYEQEGMNGVLTHKVKGLIKQRPVGLLVEYEADVALLEKGKEGPPESLPKTTLFLKPNEPRFVAVPDFKSSPPQASRGTLVALWIKPPEKTP